MKTKATELRNINMGIVGKCRTHKPDSRFDKSMTWCPVLSPVLAHWSEDWVMLSLQAKPNEKSWETPLLCCQGFAPKRTQPWELTLC